MRWVLLIPMCIACGGELDSGDAGNTCSQGEMKTACPCAQPNTIEGSCACAPLPNCDGGPRWACYALAPSCPGSIPEAGSACSTTSLTCDYVVSDGTADERICDGTRWNAVTVTTFCQ